MAVINPAQEYDIIHTLTFAEASGTCPIRLYRGSASAISGTVYYRAGTSGDWTALSVSGTDTTFLVTDTTMQIAHNWNKSGNNYMTPSFRGATNITSIAISQKSALTGIMGNVFMYAYAYDCSSLTSLAVPDTSGLTSVGNSFMYSYANGCSSLSSLDVPDTSSLTSVGSSFMAYYAYDCSSLTSLAVPDTSGLTSVGNSFMQYYARNCSSLAELVLPAVGWFEDNNVDWGVPSDRLGVLKGNVLHSGDLNSWKALTAEGKTLHTNYIRDPDLVYAVIIVTTLPVTDITTSSARLRGEIEVGGGESPFWLDFVPQYDDTGAFFNTNTVTVPKDCVLYMDVNETRNVDFDWIVNGETIRGWAGSGLTPNWLNRTISVKKGDTLSIAGAGNLATELRDTMILRLDDANGAKVAEFDFVLEPVSCYLTTAMVGYFGKDDDGIELNSMRTLRSHSGHKYPDVLDEYHRVSIQIIQGIEQSGQQEYYYGMIKDVVENIVALVANEEWQQAEHAYLNLYNWLKNEFQISKTIIAPLHYEIDGGKIFTLEGEELYSAYFQYRKKGASTWLETAKQTVTVDESLTFDAIVEDLDDNTEYEYRAVTDYGGESYYGEILTFKTKLATEYCEYNADTFRRIVVEQEYGADSLRTVLREDSYSADTERITLKYYSYSADTKRKIIQGHVFTGDTKRATIKEYTFTADTLRKLLKSYEYQADILRQVVKSYAYTADVLRRIAEEAEYQADALRKVLREDAYFADTLRKVVVITAGVYPADTVRQIIVEQEFIADAKRRIAKEFQFIADTLRHVIMPYKQLIITMSIQERQIDLSTQEREVKLEVEQMSLIGNTVRLKAEFKDFNGEYVSPENVILRIYDGYRKQVGEDIPVLPSDVGKYQYDYVIPGDVIGSLYFEFVGTIGGLPILGRATIDKRWI